MTSPATNASATPLDEPFWVAAAQGRLAMQVCHNCSQSSWPPARRCPHCSSPELTWVDVESKGRVWSYAVYHRVFDPMLEVEAPYVLAAIELEGGACIPGRISGYHERIAVGCLVEAQFERLDGDLIGPLWRVVDESS